MLTSKYVGKYDTVMLHSVARLHTLTKHHCNIIQINRDDT